MFKNIISVAAALALLVGCAEIKPVEFRGPSGVRAFAVSCTSLTECYQKIGSACGTKYRIIDVHTLEAVYPKGPGAVYSYYHTIAVECRDE